MSRAKTVVGTEIVLILGLVAFVGGMYGLENMSGKDNPINLGPLSALAFAAIPAIFWLGYFYLQDRHEPEPKHFVGGVFLIGAFIASPVSHFVSGTLFTIAPSPGLDPLNADRLWKTIILIGLVQEMCKLLVVRYSIYLHKEFDEPMDGIVYMMAAGIGFATAENFRHLLSLDGKMLLTQGAINTVVNTLAHACFAGVLGYALGRAKFVKQTALQRGGGLLAGLLAAALLNGVFNVLEERVGLAGIGTTAWRSLAWAAGFAAVVFFGVSMLMRRQLAASPHGAGAGAGKG